MHPLSRLLSRTFVCLGLTLLMMGSGDLTTAAARGDAQREWTTDERPSSRADQHAATTQRVNEQYGRLPLSFERNEGQTDPQVEFLSRGLGYALFLSAGGEAVFALNDTTGDAASRSAERAVAVATDRASAGTGGAVLRLKLAGARADAHAAGREPLPGAVNYLRGTDRAGWRTGIRTYARVAYEEVYPGVDLVYYGNQRQLEYDFIVRPGADPGVITLEAEGADRIDIDDGGDLVLQVGTLEVRQRKPVVYQERQGIRLAVEGRYVVQGSRHVAFKVGAYDPALALVIDPVLVYSTYLGGAIRGDAHDHARGVAVDPNGHAYVAGLTESTDFPTTPGAYDTTSSGDDVFVTKFDGSGDTLSYSTFLGGSDSDFVLGIAVDALGQAYVTGETWSVDFPTTPDAYDRSHNGDVDAFVTRLDSAGATLSYSTFLGGRGYDFAWGVVPDAAGHAYVVGVTQSGDFPTTPGAYDTSHNRDYDVFVTKLDVAGATLAYSTFLGGNDWDTAASVAVDPLGQAYVLGSTSSTDFPITPGAFDTTLGGRIDVFVTKLDAAGATLAYSTYVGGGEQDSPVGIAVDHLGRAYVTGYTFSPDYPTTPGAFDTSFRGSVAAFVTKLDVAGATLAFSTFLGGISGASPAGIAVDPAGDAYVTGYAFSSDFPTTPGAFDTNFGGSTDVFVTKLDSTGAILVYSTFLGSACSGPSSGGIAIDGFGHTYVVGGAEGDFPTTPGAYDRSYNGGCDVFVTKLDATGSSLRYSTYLGGRLAPGSTDQGFAVAVDESGNAYVTGATAALDFPTTAGAHDASLNGFRDVFVTKLDPTGSGPGYSTFLGGRGWDEPAAVAVDQAGNVHVAGWTNSPDFPTTVGAHDTIPSGYDTFVTKLDPAGATLVYSTFVGGDSGPTPYGLALDGNGNAYVTGVAYSTDFPTSPGAYDTSHNGGADVFVTKLDVAGATVPYSTFLGGSSDDFAAGIAVDALGQAFVTGQTRSSNFPTTVGAFDRSYNGGKDAFVTKVDANGANLAYSTFLGGKSMDGGNAVAVDALGRAYVVGLTVSDDFPTTTSGHDTSWNGSGDAFVARVDVAGGALTYSTYLGGASWDDATDVAVDHLGQAHLTGQTQSIDFPTTAGAFDTSWNYRLDSFVGKLDVDGATLAYSTFLGGSGDDVGSGIAVDPAGNSYVVGYTSSPNFPTTPGAYDTRHDSTQEAFVVKLGDGGPTLPGVNITANGADGPLTLAADDPLAIVLSLDVGSLNVVDPAEVYVGVTTPAGRLWYDAASQTLVPGLRPAYAGPLASFGPVTLVDLPNVSSLPAGPYWWFVWVDYDSNGVPNGGAFDVVLTTVQ